MSELTLTVCEPLLLSSGKHLKLLLLPYVSCDACLPESVLSDHSSGKLWAGANFKRKLGKRREKCNY